MREFKDLGLAKTLLLAVSAEGLAVPTPIQEQVIPAFIAGFDVLGIAQTGTGKTASFVLPLLHRFAEEKGRKFEPRACRALILVPTRELALQIADTVRRYSRFMKVSLVVVVGGMKLKPQVQALSGGADIVVATPGRLLDHVNAGALRLDKAVSVVLDEADQMLDLGFIPAIRKIVAELPRQRQTVLLSATMPTQIRVLAKELQTDPQEIAVSPVSRPVDRVAQSVRYADSASKRAILVEILSSAEVSRAIVFTRTKHGADKVNDHLQKAGLSSSVIHGNKSQAQRAKVLDGFRAGRTSILVATDIAARGIDVDSVSHVVNFEVPDAPESYVHRIGRTARAGRAGIAISLCDQGERARLRDIERLIGAKLHREGELAESSSRSPVRSAKPRHQERMIGAKFHREGELAESSSRSPVRSAKPRHQERMIGAKLHREGELAESSSRSPVRSAKPRHQERKLVTRSRSSVSGAQKISGSKRVASVGSALQNAGSRPLVAVAKVVPDTKESASRKGRSKSGGRTNQRSFKENEAQMLKKKTQGFVPYATLPDRPVSGSKSKSRSLTRGFKNRQS